MVPELSRVTEAEATFANLMDGHPQMVKTETHLLGLFDYLIKE